jgi:integrase
VPLKLVRRAGSDNWYLRGTVRGRSVFESAGTDDAEAAEAVRVKREAELLEESVYGKKAVATFLEAAVAYLEHDGDPRFLGRYDGGRWTGLIGLFGRRRLSSLGQQDLDEAAKKLYPTATPETRNRQCYTPFVAVWNYAVAAGMADPRDWRRPRRPKGTAKRRKPTRAGTGPTDYETAARFVAAMAPAPAMVLTTLFYTGLRPIELFALEAHDVQPDDRWIIVDSSKSGEPRGVPMHEFLVPLLATLKSRGGRLFRTPRGEPYPITEEGGGQCDSAIRGARRRTGIQGVSLYTARHTVSTQLVVRDVHPYVKDQILGHAADSMSRHYTHVPQAPLIEAINRLPVPALWRTLPWWEKPLAHSKRLTRRVTGNAADDVIRLRRDGLTLREIVAETGVSMGSVWTILNEAGMTAPRAKTVQSAHANRKNSGKSGR